MLTDSEARSVALEGADTMTLVRYAGLQPGNATGNGGDRLAEMRRVLKEQADRTMLDAAPAQLRAMIEVGLTHERDAQRARERILEQVGVLDKPTQRIAVASVQVDATMLAAMADPQTADMLEALAHRMALAAAGGSQDR